MMKRNHLLLRILAVIGRYGSHLMIVMIFVTRKNFQNGPGISDRFLGFYLTGYCWYNMQSQILDDRGAYIVTKKKDDLVINWKKHRTTGTANLPRTFSTGNVDDTFVVQLRTPQTAFQKHWLLLLLMQCESTRHNGVKTNKQNKKQKNKTLLLRPLFFALSTVLVDHAKTKVSFLLCRQPLNLLVKQRSLRGHYMLQNTNYRHLQ